MSTSPHHPAEVIPCKPEYSFRTDVRVNAWLFAALLISVAGDIVFVRQIASWSVAVRVVLGLAPLVAALFWIRSVMRWIGGMDELHRRITVAACAFATTGTLFGLMAWLTLDKAGLFEAIHLRSGLSLGISAVSSYGILTLVVLLFGPGYRLASRRYR